MLAESEGIAMTEAHWEIIELLRAYYEEFDASPANRSLVKYTKNQPGTPKGKQHLPHVTISWLPYSACESDRWAAQT